MKKFYYISFILIFVIGCGKESPTEVVFDTENNDNFDIELLSKTPDDYIYYNGTDSTGNPPENRYNAEFSINVIKNSQNRVNKISVFAQAVFNDKENPVYSPDGKFLGFKTFDVKRVTFNSEIAREKSLFRRFLSNRVVKDTLLGPSYILSRNGFGFGNPTMIKYGASIDIKIVRNDLSVVETTADIPEEITASVTTNGAPGNDLKLNLNWNGLNTGKIQIIAYGVLRSNEEKYPLFKLQTSDDGSLVIPANILANLPFERFSGLVITFLREIKKEVNGTGNNEIYFASNSIHNIVVPLN